MITLSGTVTDSFEGQHPTQILFEQMSPTGFPFIASYSATVQFDPNYHNYNYTILLPNRQFFAVSISWESTIGTSGVNHFVQPFGINVGEGVTSITCPFAFGP